MMTLSKRQDGYLDQQVILFILQYETHSLQMHPKLPFRSVIAPTPKLLERRYALILVVIPCQYLTSPSPFFQPILPSTLSHISSVAVPHLLRSRNNPCCPASMTSCSSADVFTADLVCHPHYPRAEDMPSGWLLFPIDISQSVAVLPTHFDISVFPHLICCRHTTYPRPCPYLLS